MNVRPWLLAVAFSVLGCSSAAHPTCATEGASCGGADGGTAGQCLVALDGGTLDCLYPCGDVNCPAPSVCINVERNGQASLKCYSVH